MLVEKKSSLPGTIINDQKGRYRVQMKAPSDPETPIPFLKEYCEAFRTIKYPGSPYPREHVFNINELRDYMPVNLDGVVYEELSKINSPRHGITPGSNILDGITNVRLKYKTIDDFWQKYSLQIRAGYSLIPLTIPDSESHRVATNPTLAEMHPGTIHIYKLWQESMPLTIRKLSQKGKKQPRVFDFTYGQITQPQLLKERDDSTLKILENIGKLLAVQVKPAGKKMANANLLSSALPLIDLSKKPKVDLSQEEKLSQGNSRPKEIRVAKRASFQHRMLADAIDQWARAKNMTVKTILRTGRDAQNFIALVDPEQEYLQSDRLMMRALLVPDQKKLESKK